MSSRARGTKPGGLRAAMAKIHRDVRAATRGILPVLLCGTDGVSRLPAEYRYPVFAPCSALSLVCHGDGRRLFCAVRRAPDRPQEPMEADVFRAAPRYSAWFDIEGVTRALIEQSVLETHIAALALDASNLNLSVYTRLVQSDRWIEAASFDACVQVSQTLCQPGLFGQNQ